MKPALIAAALVTASLWAHAEPVESLREFVRDVRSGRAEFTQTVTSPDGKKKKSSTGSFEFLRPNRFRFVYLKPFEQTIVELSILTRTGLYEPCCADASKR